MREDVAAAPDSDEEDLWDFGTVRPAARRGPVANPASHGLRTMNEAGMNSRRAPVASSPPKQSTADKENAFAKNPEDMLLRDTVRNSMPPPAHAPKTPSPLSPEIDDLVTMFLLFETFKAT